MFLSIKGAFSEICYKNSNVLAYSKHQGLLSLLLTVTLSPIQEIQLSISAFLSDKRFSSIPAFSSLTRVAAAARSLWSLTCCLSLAPALGTPSCCSANPAMELSSECPFGVLGAESKQQTKGLTHVPASVRRICAVKLCVLTG